MAAEKKGMVSIVILNWNGLDFTRKCIASVRKLTGYKPFEIIVVDNGSRESEVTELKKMHSKNLINKLILNETNRGFSGGNNQGVKVGSGEFFLLLNNDTEVEKGWLGRLVEVLKSRKEIGVVGPDIESAFEKGVVFGGGYVDDSGIARHLYNKDEREVEQVGGAALMFKRTVYEKIGGLEEGFNPIYFEETDFCTRARRSGFKVVFTPKSKIVHFEGGIMKKQPGKRSFVTINKNRIRYMLLHFPVSRLLKAFFWEVLRFGKNLVKLRPHWLLEAYWITLRALPDILRRRARYNKGKLHSLEEA